ncbi:MAG: hypothetical protein PWP64_801 [Candidatus Cloacimonadota bacterium]|nr:hypothetical protein [Candidatus Cloacimonadota bacterium]
MDFYLYRAQNANVLQCCTLKRDGVLSYPLYALNLSQFFHKSKYVPHFSINKALYYALIMFTLFANILPSLLNEGIPSKSSKKSGSASCYSHKLKKS